jgi:hypothetical protein
MIYDYETDLEYGRMRLTVLIEYSYDPPEQQPCKQGYYYQPGHLYIENVFVEIVEGFDGNGEVVYKYLRENITPERLKMLDDFAYSYVEDDIEGVGPLAETLTELAS